MKKIKKSYKKIKSYYRKHPKIIIPTVAVIVVILLGGEECVRAYFYTQNINSYKKSVAVESLQDTNAKLQKAVTNYDNSYFCDIDFDKIALSNEIVINPDTLQEKLVPELRVQVIKASPAPAFSSIFDFLPRVKSARTLSVEVNKGLDDIKELTTSDERIDYCLSVAKLLGELDFLQSLKKPEGVSAMLVGQLENYQQIVANSKNELINMQFPSIFEQNHINLGEILNQIAIDLRSDDNNYKKFAQSINSDVDNINEVLAEIRLKTVDLQTRPEDIDLAISLLN